MLFQPFPSIEGFHNVVKTTEVYPQVAAGPVPYRGKVKLHGTNAAVRISDGALHAQSRTQLIEVGNDNSGFAAWLATRAAWFTTLRVDPDTTVFGEWCGPGIMHGTAINRIPTKIFAVFAVMVGGGDEAVMITAPDEIERLLGERPADVHVLPWHGETFVVDYADRASLQRIADALNLAVAAVEPCDPWVKATFGLEGLGEGIVYVPDAGKRVARKRYSDLAFKAKGEKHKVVKTKQAVEVDPQVAATVDEFVTLFATEPRFEQGVAALGLGAFDMKRMGEYLKWVAEDVLKESADELEASGLEWAQVAKPLQTAARTWYLAKSRAV